MIRFGNWTFVASSEVKKHDPHCGFDCKNHLAICPVGAALGTWAVLGSKMWSDMEKQKWMRSYFLAERAGKGKAVGFVVYRVSIPVT